MAQSALWFTLILSKQRNNDTRSNTTWGVDLRSNNRRITVHRQAILLLFVESGTRKLRKVVESRKKWIFLSLPFSLMLSVPWIPRQCLSWIPRQYCCYNDAFAAALWLVRRFWVIIIGKAKELLINLILYQGKLFWLTRKIQSTNRDTHDWYQTCSMSSKMAEYDDLTVCSKLVLNWKIRIFV